MWTLDFGGSSSELEIGRLLILGQNKKLSFMLIARTEEGH